jgi:hypothetical protein
MAIEQYGNDPGATLGSTINNSTTTVTLNSATGYPSSGPFRILIGSELMQVTAISGTTLTVVRGSEGTTAASHTSGVAVTLVLSAAGLSAITSERQAKLYTDDTVPSSGSYTWVNQGSGTATDGARRMILNTGGSTVPGGSLSLFVKNMPSTPFVMTFHVIPEAPGVANSHAGVCVYDSGAGNVMTLTQAFTGSGWVVQMVKWNSPASFNSNLGANSSSIAGTDFYLRIANDGTNFTFSYSHTGIVFYAMATIGVSAFGTPNKIGYMLYSDNGLATVLGILNETLNSLSVLN